MANFQVFSGYETVLAAIGRHPLTSKLGLGSVGVETDKDGYILVDAYQNTTASGVFALGDVCGQVELTPMAIAAGRRLADRLQNNNKTNKTNNNRHCDQMIRLYGGMPNAKADYENVPTVVFSHPTIGTSEHPY